MVSIEFINGEKRLTKETNKCNLAIRKLYQSGWNEPIVKHLLTKPQYDILNELSLEIVLHRIKELNKVLKGRSLSIDELHGQTHKDKKTILNQGKVEGGTKMNKTIKQLEAEVELYCEAHELLQGKTKMLTDFEEMIHCGIIPMFEIEVTVKETLEEEYGIVNISIDLETACISCNCVLDEPFEMDFNQSLDSHLEMLYDCITESEEFNKQYILGHK